MSTGTSRKRAPRRSLQQTRALMLEAAVNLVRAGVDDPAAETVGAALAGIRLTEVAAEATRIVRSALPDGESCGAVKDITTGAIYQVWPSQAQFQADLLLHIADLYATSESLIDQLGPLIDAAAAAGQPSSEALRQIVTRSFVYTRDSALFYTSLSFYIRSGNPQVRAALARATETFLTEIGPVWRRLLSAYDLRMRAPYTLASLSLVIGSLIEGLALEWVGDPRYVEDPAGEASWSLPARAAVMVFERMTEPAGA